ncbi:TIGR02679 family protein [Actinospica durhamensis]|uniref:TIGR02679 family protein n=1 Tax=Actinospica durhamensis TaxID=1508375 RepID=A0A941EST5_9ACTN|nr:TIGR02679 family protein [Actinospica durhamensis]MBR7837422.1 TIGR02679 family protein [Actinospica durhamensis]
MNAHDTDFERLTRVLGTPETAWLIERVRRRAAEGRPLTGNLTLTSATPAQRRAIDTLLGRPPSRGASLSVRMEELDTLLRTAGIHPGGLRGAVEELTGPIPDNKAKALADAHAWQYAYEPLDAVAVDNAYLEAWWTRPSARGTLKRLAGGDSGTARSLAAQAAAVLTGLPSDGISLPVLAARVTGDAHALDHDQPVGRLVLAATEQWAGSISPDPEALLALPKSEQRRAHWAELGVSLDELSSRVLAFGLPGNPSGAGSLGPILAVAREHGEPLALTLRQVRQGAAITLTDAFGVGPGEVFICENPAVLEAAARRVGPDCPPLICVEGQLSVAARALLRALRARGATFRYHGDFDWGGLRIGRSVFALTGATPWRFSYDDYLKAIEAGHGSRLDTGAPCDASWDPRLREAISTHAVRVEEEHIIEDLLSDLDGYMRQMSRLSESAR